MVHSAFSRWAILALFGGLFGFASAQDAAWKAGERWTLSDGTGVTTSSLTLVTESRQGAFSIDGFAAAVSFEARPISGERPMRMTLANKTPTSIKYTGAGCDMTITLTGPNTALAEFNTTENGTALAMLRVRTDDGATTGTTNANFSGVAVRTRTGPIHAQVSARRSFRSTDGGVLQFVAPMDPSMRVRFSISLAELSKQEIDNAPVK